MAKIVEPESAENMEPQPPRRQGRVLTPEQGAAIEKMLENPTPPLPGAVEMMRRYRELTGEK
jgi:hypothetical protein